MYYVTLAVLGESHVVKPSHLLDHMNPNCELKRQITMCYTVMLYILALIYYSGVLNKVSSYTVLVESCCDALQNQKNLSYCHFQITTQECTR